jgi:hypothetical protein
MGDGQFGVVIGSHRGTGPPSEKLVFTELGMGDGQFGVVIGSHRGTGPPSEKPIVLLFFEPAIAETVPRSIKAARAVVAIDFMAEVLLSRVLALRRISRVEKSNLLTTLVQSSFYGGSLAGKTTAVSLLYSQ